MIRLLTEEDKVTVEAYLERYAVETVLLASNVRRYGIENDRLSRRSGDYYGYFAGSQLRGILALYNLGSVIPHFDEPAAAQHFARIMAARRFEVMAGMKQVVEPLERALYPHKLAQMYEESYCLINQANKPGSAERPYRVVDAADIDRSKALDFIVEAYRLGFQRRFNRELAAKLLDDRGCEEDFVFRTADGEPQAQAMIQAVTDQVTQIAGVYTNERSRCQGYCKEVVAELCRRSRIYGKMPTLMVRKDNFPAIRAYRDIGFTYYGDYLVVKYIV